jgi:hypothetical protein
MSVRSYQSAGALLGLLRKVLFNILVFCSLLSPRYDREELEPKFLFVEL